MIFWLIVALLVVLALALTLIPLLSRKASEDVERNQVNIALFKERLAELEALELPAADFKQAKQELEKDLLHDLSEEGQSSGQVRARWGAVLAALMIVGIAAGMYVYTERPTPEQLAEIEQMTQQRREQAAQAQQQKQNMPSIDEMVGRLEQKLEQTPDDVEGWRMLARSYEVMERYDDAVTVYQRLLGMGLEKDVDLLADYAETKGFSQQGQLAGEPMTILEKAVALNPQHPKTLWLLGLAQVQLEDYPRAVHYWEALLALVPPDSDAWKSVNKYVQEARAQAGMPSTTPTMAMANPGTAAPQQQTAASGAKLTIEVSLAPELQDKAKPTDKVMVYARAAQGPRMPLAITVLEVAQLPATVTLDDSMAMMPNMRLSSVPEMVAIARITEQQSAMPQSGDLIGETEAFKLAEQTGAVQVQVNRLLP